MGCPHCDLSYSGSIASRKTQVQGQPGQLYEIVSQNKKGLEVEALLLPPKK